jgi:hypothetical protein
MIYKKKLFQIVKMSSMVTWLWAPHARSIASTLAHFKLCCVVSCCLLCCHQLQRPCRISNAWQGSSGQVPENWQKEHLWRSELCKRTIVLQKIYLSSRKKKKRSIVESPLLHSHRGRNGPRFIDALPRTGSRSFIIHGNFIFTSTTYKM